MTKLDLARAAGRVLREKGFKKHGRDKKSTFKICDDEGNSRNFVIKHKGNDVPLNVEDIEEVIDALLEAIEYAVRHNETISIKGFGEFYLEHKPERYVLHPVTKEKCLVPEKYKVKFKAGKRILIAERLYQLSTTGEDIDKYTEADSIFADIENEEGDE